MPTLSIYRDTRSLGTCRSCGARVEWAQLITGKRMPFDPPLVVVRRQQSFLARDVDVVDMEATRSHFASCPEAAQWRRK
jgi:hypothetical protein